jgi:hypothetical protein
MIKNTIDDDGIVCTGDARQEETRHRATVAPGRKEEGICPHYWLSFSTT